MAIVVEHEKRKREILEKSFQLFIEDGYEDVTYPVSYTHLTLPTIA